MLRSAPHWRRGAADPGPTNVIGNGSRILLPSIGGAPTLLQRMLGYAMAPVCWLMGLPWDHAVTAGGLMGIKTILNELIAYVDLSKLGTDALDARSRLIMLYAMCGFANFASLGIMIGGLGTMAPPRAGAF
jgi:concentrative nucleoside transporter, CNT family